MRTPPPDRPSGLRAATGAIDTLTVGLARQVAADGIRVDAVRAGVICTDMHAIGRAPEDVADAIPWLLSDAASYLRGSLTDVTGGK